MPRATSPRSLLVGAVTAALIASGMPLASPASAVGGCTITGTPRADTLVGTDGDDIICGLGGDDTLIGLGGDDTLIGDTGSDVLDGGDGNDSLDGGNEHDQLRGGDGDDVLRGATGMDLLDGGAGDDDLAGGNDADRLVGGAGADHLSGDLGIDLLSGGAGNDVLIGGNDQDTLLGGPGDDSLSGQLGNDVLAGNSGVDVLDGGNDQDRCYTSVGPDSYVSCESRADSPASAVEEDLDGDGFGDDLELLAGTDLTRADTDGDGLRDVDEYATATEPLRADTDNDGVRDAAEDADGDGVANGDELRAGTNPARPDSDGDGLTDGRERSYRTIPTDVDTDRDALTDGQEVELGTDPLVADSDADGVTDGQDTHSRELADSTTGATFVATGVGAAVLDVALSAPQDARFVDVPGQRGPPIEVLTGGAEITGTLTLRFDPATVDPAENLAILHYDDATGTFDVPENQQVDARTGTATVTTSNFSPFLLVDRDEFDAIWESKITTPRSGTGSTYVPLDAAVVLDSSGSMAWNDPAGARRLAGKSFVDALLSDDRIAVVDFDDWATVLQALTVDKEAAKAAIDRIDDYGGTDIGAGMQAALDQLDALGEAGRERVVVLLTDGEGSYSSSLTARAVASRTVVYTVGLGSSVDDALLSSIAEATGGRYYQVTNADQLLETFGRIGGDLGAADSDGDGVADEAEVTGVRDGTGHVYKTDPNDADTDGDGLSDGDELGELVDTAGFGAGTYYVTRTDPTKADTDGDFLDDWYEVANTSRPRDADYDRDGLDDYDELEIYFTEPLANDTDADGHTDDWEIAHSADGFDPRVYDESYAWYEYAGDFSRGALCGDITGWGGFCDGESVPYFAGSITAGFVGVGDVRDAGANLFGGHVVAAGLSLVSLVPYLGDAASVVRKAAKLIERVADGTRAAKLLRHVAEAGYLSSGAKIKILDAATGGAAKASKAYGMSEHAILSFAQLGLSPKYVKKMLDASARVRTGAGSFDREFPAEQLFRAETPGLLTNKPGRALVPGGPRNARYFDAIDPEAATGYEVKFGLVPKLGRAGRQVAKDGQMLRTGANADIRSIEWHFYSDGWELVGPDPDLLQELIDEGIPFVIHLS